jgi:hypothetical protein
MNSGTTTLGNKRGGNITIESKTKHVSKGLG